LKFKNKHVADLAIKENENIDKKADFAHKKEIYDWKKINLFRIFSPTLY